jgi:hypothetical protein
MKGNLMISATAANDLPIVCDPNALTTEQSERWMVVGKQMYQAIQEVRELPNGYAFRLPSDADMLMIVAEDLSLDRLCCPFILYTLEITPAGGPLWLSFTGGEGVKEFLRFSFEESNLLDEAVARAAGFDVTARKDIDSVEIAVEMTYRINERAAKAASGNND